MLILEKYISNRILLLKFETVKGLLSILGVYNFTTQNKEGQDEIFKEVDLQLSKLQTGQVMMCGDLNAQLARSEVKSDPMGRWFANRKANSSGKILHKILADNKLRVANSFFQKRKSALSSLYCSTRHKIDLKKKFR